jgi:hypothetical protein
MDPVKEYYYINMIAISAAVLGGLSAALILLFSST